MKILWKPLACTSHHGQDAFPWPFQKQENFTSLSYLPLEGNFTSVGSRWTFFPSFVDFHNHFIELNFAEIYEPWWIPRHVVLNIFLRKRENDWKISDARDLSNWILEEVYELCSLFLMEFLTFLDLVDVRIFALSNCWMN